MDANQIANIINIALIAVLVLLIIGVFLAALIGYKRGLHAACFRFIFALCFILICVFSLQGIYNLISAINLGGMGLQDIVITNDKTGASEAVSWSTVGKTLSDVVYAFYRVYNNASGHEAELISFANSLASSILKLIIFAIEMLIMVTLGNILATILWHTLFKNVFPKAIRKLTRLPWAGLGINIVKYLMVAFMFMAPLTSIVNTVNYSYKKNKSDDASSNENLEMIDTFMSAYNNSAFASTLFSWTTDSSGLTLDARVMSKIVSTTSEYGTMQFYNDLYNITEIAIDILPLIDFENQSIDYSALLDGTIVSTIFDSLASSPIITMALPIAMDILVNSDLIKDTIDLSKLYIDDLTWKDEILAIKEVVMPLFETGILDEVIDEKGFKVDDDLWPLMQTSLDALDDIEESLSNIDNVKLLDRLIPVLLDFATANNEDAKKWINATYEELCEVSWGQELASIIEGVNYLYSLDKSDEETGYQGFVERMYRAINKKDEANKNSLKVKKENDESSDNDISQYFEIFFGTDIENGKNMYKPLVSTLIGPSKDGEIIEDIIDKETGLVDIEKKKIYLASHSGEDAGPLYSLLDLDLVRFILPEALNSLIDLLSDIYNDESQKEEVSQDLEIEINNILDVDHDNKAMILNVKNEFSHIFYAFEAFSNNPSAISDLLGGEIFQDGDLSSISDDLIDALNIALPRLDNSNLLYVSITPMLENAFSGTTGNESPFASLGIDDSDIEDGFTYCIDNHCLGEEISALLDIIKCAKGVLSIFSNSEINADTIAKLVAEDYVDSNNTHYNNEKDLKRILNIVLDSNILNYQNKSFTSVMMNIMASMLENENDKTAVEDALKEISMNEWRTSFDASDNIINEGEIGNLVNTIKNFATPDNGASYSLLSFIMDTPEEYSETFKMLEGLESECHLGNVLKSVDNSKAFKVMLPYVLDNFTAESGLTDATTGISFHNVTSWANEANNLSYLLNNVSTFQDMLNGELDLSKFDNSKVVTLNNCFHKLASSQIFTKENYNLFGEWLYSKINASLDDIAIGENNVSLISDPINYTGSFTSWVNSWDVDWLDYANEEKFNNYYEKYTPTTNSSFFTYLDFLSIKDIEDSDNAGWCNTSYFEYTSENEDGYYNQDEISRICYLIKCASCISSDARIEDLSLATFSSLTSSIANLSCLRMGTYALYKLATDSIGDSAKDIIDFASANTNYLVSCGLNDMNPTSSRARRIDEINNLNDIFSQYKTISNATNGILNNGNLEYGNFNYHEGNNYINIKAFESFLNDLATSHVFNLAGPNKGNDVTTYQGTFVKICSLDLLKDVYYYDASIKDIANAALYNSASSKATYYVKENLPYTVSNDIFKNENKNLTSILEYAYRSSDNGGLGLTGDAFSFSSLDDISADGVYNILTAINASNILYDIVPNYIHKMLNTETMKIDGLDVNLSDASVYYHYDLSNFDAHYPESDILTLSTLISDYKNFKTALDDNIDLSSVNSLKSLLYTDYDNEVESNILKSLLKDVYDLNSMHSYNQYLSSNDKCTVYESFVKELVNKCGISEYTYSNKEISDNVYNDANEKLLNKIKNISNSETDINKIYFVGNEGEIENLLDFFRSALSIFDGQSNLDMSSISLDTISKDDFNYLLTSLNNVTLINDAVGNFIRTGFANIGLTDLLKYEDEEQGSYYIGKSNYSKSIENGLTTSGEIYNIYSVLSGLENPDYDINDVNSKRYLEIKATGGEDDIINNTTILPVMFNYLFNSDIFSQTYLTNQTSGYDEELRGLMFYNILEQQSISGGSINKYITGNNKDEKITVLTNLFKYNASLDNVSDRANMEANAITSIASKASELSSVVTSTDLKDLAAKGDTLVSILKDSYNYNNTGERVYFMSEIVSNLLNDVVKTELDKFINYNYFKGYLAYFRFGNSNFKQINMVNIENVYANLNKKETDGLDGVLKLFSATVDLNNIGDLIALDTSSDGDLSTAFNLMGESNIAKIIYIADAHPTLNNCASINLPIGEITSRMVLTSLISESDMMDTSGTKGVFALNFTFANITGGYGNSLLSDINDAKTYLSPYLTTL